MSALVRITLVLLIVYTAVSTAVSDLTLVAVSAGPINVNVFDVLLLVAAALLVREVTLEHGVRMPGANRTVMALVFGYCAYQIAVVLPVAVIFHHLEPIAVARQLESRLAIVLIPFVYLVGLKYVSSRRLVAWVNVAAACMAFYAAYKYATGPPLGEEVEGVFRIRQLWGAAIPLFGFLILTSLFLRRPTLLAYLAAMVGVLGFALTNTRSGYVALVATVPPLLINSRRVARRALVVSAVIASSVLLLFMVSPAARESALYSLETIANPSADRNAKDRVDRSRLGWDYFVAHPLGDYQWSKRYYLVYVGPDAFEPHNFVIQLLGQQGIVGFVFFGGILFATARIAWRNRRADRMSAVMLAYLGFYLVFCLFNTNFLNPHSVFLLVLPIALILARNAAPVENGEEDPDCAAGSARHRLPAVSDSGR